jgi:hypothetical protein
MPDERRSQQMTLGCGTLILIGLSVRCLLRSPPSGRCKVGITLPGRSVP